MKNRINAFFLILILAFVSGVQADDTCLPQAAVNQILRDFTIVTWSEKLNDWQPTETVNLCDAENILTKTIYSILYMQVRSTKKSAGSSVLKDGAYAYFKSRIKTIYIEAEYHSLNCTMGDAVAYVSKGANDSMHICPEGMQSLAAGMMVSSVLVHEARHIDGFNHIHCDRGALAPFDADSLSRGSCDESYEGQGSYGVGASFLLDVYKTTSDPEERQVARGYLVADLIQRFNKLPLGMKSGAITQSTNGEISFFDGQKKTPMKVAPQLGVMALRGDNPLFFDADGVTKNFLYSETLFEAQGLFAAKFKTKFSPDEQKSLIDIAYSKTATDYGCFLFETKIRCSRGYEDDIDISLAAIKPVGLIRNGNSALVKGSAIYIAAADGYIYQLPETFKELALMNESNLIKSKGVLGLKNLVVIDRKNEIGLDLNGRLVRYDNDIHRWQPALSYRGESIKKIVAPIVWSPQLEAL